MDQLPNELILTIFGYLPISNVFRMSQLDRNINRLLVTYRKLTQKRILECPWEGFGHKNIDVPWSRLFDNFVEKYTNICAPYTQNKWRPTVQRFFAFKTSGGVDDMLHQYSPTVLFNPLKNKQNFQG